MNSVQNNSSVDSETIVDEYALNDESIKFAQCFSLNNYEVNIIKDYFKKLQKVNGFEIIKELNLNKMPLYNCLFRIYENDSLSWNDFFQFTLFFSLSPTVMLYYFILHALCSCSSSVEWTHLVKLFKLIKRHQAICDEINILFKQHDLNNDGKVSLNQFFNFLSLSFALFDPINYFRLAMISNILSFERIKIILERKADINNINKYLESNSSLPPEPCLVRINRLMKGQPHPMKCDYDNRMDEISINNILEIYIKKYDSEYVFKQESFAIKYLTAFKLNVFIREIDELYLKIRTNNPEYNRRRSLLPTARSDLGKISVEPVEVRKKSILRPRRLSNVSGSTRRASASGQIYSLASPSHPQHHFPKGNSLSSKNLVTSQSSIVPII